jgi:RHS repeat-associated protein
VAGGVVYVTLSSNTAPKALYGLSVAEQGGAPNLAEDQVACSSQPVNCATGELWRQFTDFRVPGRGIPLVLTRTYVSADAGTPSAFGYGWSDSYGMSLTPPDATGLVTIRQEDGATVTFRQDAKGRFTAPPWVMATLLRNHGGGFTFIRYSDQVRYVFSETGRLILERDLDGDTTSLSYSGSELTKVTDATGRSLLFGYQGGHVTTVTGPMGATEHLRYSPSGTLTRVTDPAGRPWSFGYNHARLLTSITDPRGLVTRIKYGAGRRVTAVSGPGYGHTAWAYTGSPVSSAGGTTTQAGPGRTITTYRYASLELMAVTRGAGSAAAATTSYTYNPQALVASVTDPNRHVTSYTYNRAGDLLTATDPLNHAIAYTYNDFGEVTSETLPGGTTSRLWYDTHGNLTMTQDAAGNITTYTPDPAHPSLVAEISGPGGRTTMFTYNAYGDATTMSVSPRAGVTDTTRYSYDAAGQLTCLASPDATARHYACPAPGPTCPVYGRPHALGTTSYALNCDGEVTSVTDPSGSTTSYSYGLDGSLTKITDAEGNVTAYSYNGAGQPLQVTRNGIVIASATYNAAGRLMTQSPVPGEVTRYQYDPLGRVVTMTDPLNLTTRYAYDPGGNLIQSISPSGKVMTYTYDAGNELTGVAYGASSRPAISYAYNPDGQQSQVTDPTGITRYSYDGDHRLLAATHVTPAGASSGYSYAYHDAANTVTLTYPNGRQVTDRYDTAGQLVKISDWLGNIITFHYDASGNLTSEDAPGVRAVYGATSITIAHQAGVMAIFGYVRNKAGLIAASAAVGVPGGSPKPATYAYTKRGELAKEGSLSYGYDTAGNLASSSTGFTQAYNPAGELRTRAAFGVTTKYTYDLNGNLIQAATTGGPTTNLAYDPANRLTSYSAPGLTASYAYNGDGLLTTTTANNSQTELTWDQAQQVPLLLSSTSAPASAARSPSTSSSASPSPSPSQPGSPPPSPSPSGSGSPSAPGSSPAPSATPPPSAYTSYIYGPAGQPVEQIRGGTATFLLADRQGSVRLLTNTAGQEVGALSYGPYGRTNGQSGKATTALRYDGQYTDPSTGYIYLRARYYDPQTGQFLTRDPQVALTGAPYSYAGNNPVNASDPTGLSWWNPFSWSPQTWSYIGWIATGVAVVGSIIVTGGTDLPLIGGLAGGLFGGGSSAAEAAVATTEGLATAEGVASGAATAEGIVSETAATASTSAEGVAADAAVPAAESTATAQTAGTTIKGVISYIAKAASITGFAADSITATMDCLSPTQSNLTCLADIAGATFDLWDIGRLLRHVYRS